MDTYDVILVQLYSELQPPNADPLSIEVLAGALEQCCQGCRVKLVVVNPIIHSRSLQELLITVSMSECKLIGLSVPQGTYPLAIEVLSALDDILGSSRFPLVMIGHALPTYIPEAFLQRYPRVVAVRGWGEDALIQLVRMVQAGDVSLSNVPGIVYMDRGQLAFTPLRNEIIPLPPKRIDPEKYFPRVETSRGCHYGRCTFCTRPPGAKDYWTRLPLDPLLASIRELKDQGILYFTFTDEDFIGNDLEGALELARGIAEIGEMNFSLAVRADNIFNPKESVKEISKRLEVLKILRRAGLSWVFIGVESLSDSQLRRYGKGIRAQDSVQATDIIKSLDIMFEVGFILFDPFVLVEELHQTARVLRTSGMWKNVSNLFSPMRVQKNTPYEYGLRKKGLLQSFNINLLSYDWEFQDQRAADVAKVCLSWELNFNSIYRLLRNLERSKQDNNTTERFMMAFRHLDLLVLEHVLAQVEERGLTSERPPTIAKSFYSQRHTLALALEHAVRPQVKSDEEGLLLDVLDQFLAQPLSETAY